MSDFTMTAPTVDGSWYTFSVQDVPCMIDDDHFVLLRKSNSPVLCTSVLRRGFDKFTEGDVWKDASGREWLICYERGFYAIDKDYTIVYLTDCADWEKVGYCLDIDFPVKCTYRTKHLFKTKGMVYRLSYIYGMHADRVLIRGIPHLVDPKAIKQECCLTYNNQRIFLGDLIDGVPVQLYNGRVTIKTPGNKYKDISTGGFVC